MRILAPFIAGIALGVSLFGCNDPVWATYNGPKFSVDPEVGAWVSELTSDYGGRCCEFSDALPDDPWRSNASSPSGYQVLYEGQWIDVDPAAMNIFQRHFDPKANEYVDLPVTDNKVGVALVWMMERYASDGSGNPIAAVRCFLPGGAG